MLALQQDMHVKSMQSKSAHQVLAKQVCMDIRCINANQNFVEKSKNAYQASNARVHGHTSLQSKARVHGKSACLAEFAVCGLPRAESVAPPCSWRARVCVFIPSVLFPFGNTTTGSTDGKLQRTLPVFNLPPELMADASLLGTWDPHASVHSMGEEAAQHQGTPNGAVCGVQGPGTEAGGRTQVLSLMFWQKTLGRIITEAGFVLERCLIDKAGVPKLRIGKQCMHGMKGAGPTYCHIQVLSAATSMP
eukprot:1161864-Pelagomonas_calceolata.AAC.9